MENTLTIELPPFPPCGEDEKWERVTEGEVQHGDMFLCWGGFYKFGWQAAGAGHDVKFYACLIRRVHIDPRDAEIERMKAQIDALKADLRKAHDALDEAGKTRDHAVNQFLQEQLRGDKMHAALLDEVCLRLGRELYARELADGQSGPRRGAVTRDGYVASGRRGSWIVGPPSAIREMLREVHGEKAQKIVAEMLGESK